MMLTTLLALTFALLGGYPTTHKDQLIDRFAHVIQARFAAPPAELGMSRVAIPRSFGGHFIPLPGATTDFRPETIPERALIQEMTTETLAAGFYVFGAAIVAAPPESHDFRALKGPAVITPITVRGKVPDWKSVYPFAREAMQAFERGERSFDASIGGWRLVARAVPAGSPSCVGCHNNPMIGSAGHRIALGHAIGGVLYVYR